MKGITNKIGRLRLNRKAVVSSVLITVVAVGGFLLFSKATPASATANGCTVGASDSTTTFDDTVKAGSGINTTQAGTYTLWLRMMAPDTTNNTLRVSVDGGACITMGAQSGSSLSPNAWTWVDTQNGTNTVVTFNLGVNNNHTMVVVGNNGVQLDTFQLLTNGCTPQDTAGFNFLTNPGPYPGKNCIDLAQEQPPTVSISAPANNATFTTGATVPIQAIANDSIAVTQVVIKVDGNAIATDTTAPYSANWTATAGTHTITATATDTGNQSTTSTAITVTVNNPTCSGNPTDPSNLHDTDSAPLPAGKVDLGWSASTAAANCTLAGYNIYRNGSTTPLNTGLVNALVYNDSTVAATTTYTYQIEAQDTAGHKSNKVPATPLSVTTGTNCALGNGAPTTPASLAQTAGTSDYTTITMNWSASTLNNGCTLSGYHIYRDGSTTPIATLGLVTTFKDNGPLASGGSHNYSIDAFDSGGNKSPGSGVIAMTTKADDVAPSLPTGVTGANQSGSVLLSWTASTDLPNPGAVGVKNYDIYRCTGAACTPPAETSAPNFTSVSTSFTDSTVTTSTTYRYVISAVDNNNNQSSQSAIVTVVTPAPTCSGAPTTPTNLHATGATLNTIDLAWTASTPAAGCTLQGYQVFRNHSLLTTVSGTSFTDSGLTPNTPYIYYLIAVETSSSNNTSPQTPDFTTNTMADTTPPTQPTNFVVSAPNPTQVSLGWTAATDNVSVTGYNIYRNGTLLKSVAAVTNATDLTVSANTTYTYLLEAFDAAGNKSTPKTASTPATITTPQAADTTPPTTPGQPVAGVVGTTSVALTWAPSTDNVAVAGYNVYRNGSTTPVNTTLVSSPSFTDTGLTPNTTYTYAIKAVDTSGNASVNASPSTSVTTQPVITPVPGDIDSNGIVNGRDFNILLVHWHQTVTPPNTNGDLDNSGYVDGRDLNMFLIDWGIYNKANGL